MQYQLQRVWTSAGGSHSLAHQVDEPSCVKMCANHAKEMCTDVARSAIHPSSFSLLGCNKILNGCFSISKGTAARFQQLWLAATPLEAS